jgi:hypothetical protein
LAKNLLGTPTAPSARIDALELGLEDVLAQLRESIRRLEDRVAALEPQVSAQAHVPKAAG